MIDFEVLLEVFPRVSICGKSFSGVPSDSFEYVISLIWSSSFSGLDKDRELGEANAEIKALRLAERLREKAVEEVRILPLHVIFALCGALNFHICKDSAFLGVFFQDKVGILVLKFSVE